MAFSSGDPKPPRAIESNGCFLAVLHRHELMKRARAVKSHACCLPEDPGAQLSDMSLPATCRQLTLEPYSMISLGLSKRQELLSTVGALLCKLRRLRARLVRTRISGRAWPSASDGLERRETETGRREKRAASELRSWRDRLFKEARPQPSPDTAVPSVSPQFCHFAGSLVLAGAFRTHKPLQMKEGRKEGRKGVAKERQHGCLLKDATGAFRCLKP